MSLILDALNRSRQESDPVPGLATRHDTNIAQSPPAWRQSLPWMALVVALLMIAFLLFERDAATPVPVISPPPNAAIPAAGLARPGSSPTVPIEVSAAPESLPAAAQPSLDASPAITDSAEAVGEISPRETPSPAVTNVVDPAIAQLYERPEASTAGKVADPVSRERLQAPAEKAAAAQLVPAQEEEQVDIEQLVMQAQEEIEDARLAEHSAPFITELSQQVKNAIPTVYYQRHDFAGNGEQSKVVLNGESMGQGGSPVAGMTVVEILPDSVVLNYRGDEFRLRALNSWINL